MKKVSYRVVYGNGYLIAAYTTKVDALKAAQKLANTGKLENVSVIECVNSNTEIQTRFIK